MQIQKRWWIVAGTLVGFVIAAPHLQLVAQQASMTPGGNLRINPMIARLEHGQVAEMGDSWTFIDMEHQPYVIEQLRPKFEEAAAKRSPSGQLLMTPVVRIPMYGDESPRWAVKQVLDSGGMTIVFPGVETKEQATRAVRSMRFAPQRGTKYPDPPGIRGYAGATGGKLWGVKNVDEYLQRADVWPLNPEGELFAIIMIESAAGVKNVNEIVDTPGLGAIFIGPMDLSISLGVGPQKGNVLPPETEEAVHTVLKACLAKKVVCGIAATWATKERRAQLKDEGFKLIM